SLIDGSLTPTCYANGDPVANLVIGWDFDATYVIDEITWKQTNSTGLGTWQAQGFDGSSWVNLGSTFTLGGSTSQAISLGGNTTAYRAYRLLGVSGSFSTSPDLQEVEFKIDTTAGAVSTKYSNTDGKGNRTSDITVTVSGISDLGGRPWSRLVDGDLTTVQNFDPDATPSAGVYLRFDFGTARKIDESILRTGRLTTGDSGTWKWQGSANASVWTDIGSSFTWPVSADSFPFTALNGNTTTYRYYQLIGVSGNINAYNDLQEWEFRIDAPASPPVLGCNSPPTGTMGVAYSHTLSTTGGTSPFYYVITAGSLPPGLYIGASDGTITGTPVTYGTYSFTATVTDNVSLTDDAACSITINPTTLGIACNTPPGGTVGLPYSHAFSASGGVTPYTFAITSGSLPSGITLSASTGTVSG
ncbi:MAG TPA: Ig domain-containing protein, partial [Gemmatimonadales bacterium]